MEPLSLAWITDALRLPAAKPDAEVNAVSTDSREISPGALFVALRGETFDGHAYVEAAFHAGAVAALVEKPVFGVEGQQIVVPDTLCAYGDLARAYRRRFPALHLVAVTGSVGKTSTKEMIAAVLKTRFRTLATEKNYNNEIGVPKTLFSLTSDQEAAVLEMGMRGLGEISRLAEIAEPTLGVITNIGYAHIERLGSRENIAKAKTELFESLRPGAAAIFPIEDDFAETIQRHIPAGVEARGISTKGTPLSLSVPGVHQEANARLALAVAERLKIPLADALAALQAWGGAEGRMSVRQAGTLTILDDCYNAGVESMRAALQTLKQIKARKNSEGVAVLGEMKELGGFAPELHREVGRAAAQSDLRLLITVGEGAKQIAETALGIPHFHANTSEEAVPILKQNLFPNEVVLVKGSRAVGMEKIVEALLSDSEGKFSTQ